MGGAGRHYTPSGGCPWRPLEPLFPDGVTGPSLGALWDSLKGFGWVLSLRCEVAKVSVLEHLGTARAPLYCFQGSFALARLLLGSLGRSCRPCGCPLALSGCALGAIDVFLGDLSRSALFLCYLGGARCAIRTCLCMSCKGSPPQKRLSFETLLRQPDVHKRGQEGLRRAGEAPRAAPETLDSYKNGAQAPL